jgi:hypothetical protein
MKVFSMLFAWIKKAWTAIVVVSVLFGFYSYFHEKRPDVQFTIVGDPNVFDVYKSVNDLEIFFRDKNIEKEDLNLKIYTIRVENTGEADILKNSYDESLPWGFSIENGEIVSDPRVVKSNSQYLESNLNPRLENGHVEFQKVILERGKYFIIEFLVLHKKDNAPSILTFGKIAGVDQFIVLRDSEQGKKPTLNILLEGSVIMHLIKLIVYTTFSVILLIVIAFISDRIEKIKIRRKEKKRRIIFQEYTENEPILDSDLSLFLEDLYVKSDLYGVKKFRKRMKDEKGLLSELSKGDTRNDKDWIAHTAYHSMDEGFLFPLRQYYNKDLLGKLVMVENNTKTLNPNLKIEINKLIPYLNKIKQ